MRPCFAAKIQYASHTDPANLAVRGLNLIGYGDTWLCPYLALIQLYRGSWDSDRMSQ